MRQRGHGGQRVSAVVAALLAAGLVLTACSSGATPGAAQPAPGPAGEQSPAADAGGSVGPGGATGSSGGVTAEPIESPTPELPKKPHLNVRKSAPYDEPIRVGVSNGTVVEASVTSAGGAPLAGERDGVTHWQSDGLPVPGETYTIKATVADTAGTPHALAKTFQVEDVREADRLTLSLRPGKGEVVGIGAPIVVTFDQEVTNRRTVEAALKVQSSKPVYGAWRWLSSRQAQFRPKNTWKPGTKVRAYLDLDGVNAGPGLWGGRAYDWTFTVGSARTAIVDARAHRFTLLERGRVVARWPTSLGAPQHATRNGRYIVLEKLPVANMTSCGAGLTCDPGDADFYDLQVKWSVRVTNSGAFVHAAPWSTGSQGSANVSHGCINLSTERALRYYQGAKYGDMVTVVRSSRGASDLLLNGDPGMANWNRTFAEWVNGSAFKKPVRTQPLGTPV